MKNNSFKYRVNPRFLHLWRVTHIVCMEYTVSVPATVSADKQAKDSTGLDRGGGIPLMLSDGSRYGTKLKDRIQPLAERIKYLQKRFN